eukprot:366069-Chlamydomonas_euryale.AAC.8
MRARRIASTCMWASLPCGTRAAQASTRWREPLPPAAPRWREPLPPATTHAGQSALERRLCSLPLSADCAVCP